MPEQKYCCLCYRRCNLNSRRHVPPGIKFRRYIKRITGKDCLETDVLCNLCIARVYRSLPTQDKVQLSRPELSGDAEYLPQQSSTAVFNSPKSISLQIPSTPRTHKYCFVCRRDGSRRLRLVQIPQSASTHAFIQTGILSTRIIDVAVIIWNFGSSTDMLLDWKLQEKIRTGSQDVTYANCWPTFAKWWPPIAAILTLIIQLF